MRVRFYKIRERGGETKQTESPHPRPLTTLRTQLFRERQVTSWCPPNRMPPYHSRLHLRRDLNTERGSDQMVTPSLSCWGLAGGVRGGHVGGEEGQSVKHLLSSVGGQQKMTEVETSTGINMLCMNLGVRTEKKWPKKKKKERGAVNSEEGNRQEFDRRY